MVSNDGEVTLLDNGSGRMMKGVKLRGGQHQALEAKERLKISQEHRSVAAITFQNLFLLFPKMAGMSGTMEDASKELRSVYGAEVLVIPPNCPQKRMDLPDCYFKNAELQFQAALEDVLKIHETGRPILIVASTIGETEFVSERLVEEKIPHSVLNANNAFWEAEVIKEAGQWNAVTVATSIAGRGTDIKLSEGVEEIGGLAVIGIGRMANVRLERQAKGRAGRQGDAGTSRFFVSLEDSVVERCGPSNLDKYIKKGKWISRRKLKKIINKAQRLGEESAVSSRKSSVDYDKVLQRQRDLIYETRNHLLDGGEVPMEQIRRMAEGNIERFLKSKESTDKSEIYSYILDNISYRLDEKMADVSLKDNNDIKLFLMEKVEQRVEEQEKKLGSRKALEDFVRVAVLSAIDNAWVEQVDYAQQLRAAVSGRATAQRNVLFEYQNDAFESYEKMENTVYKTAMRNILLSDVYFDEKQKLHILFP